MYSVWEASLKGAANLEGREIFLCGDKWAVNYLVAVEKGGMRRKGGIKMAVSFLEAGKKDWEWEDFFGRIDFLPASWNFPFLENLL